MYGRKAKGHVYFKLLECYQCHQSPEKRELFVQAKVKGHVFFYLLESKGEGNSESTSNFYQSPETKKASVEARALARLKLKTNKTIS